MTAKDRIIKGKIIMPSFHWINYKNMAHALWFSSGAGEIDTPEGNTVDGIANHQLTSGSPEEKPASNNSILTHFSEI